MAEHVANEEDQGAENGENHHSDDPWWRQEKHWSFNRPQIHLSNTTFPQVPGFPQTPPSPIKNTKLQKRTATEMDRTERKQDQFTAVLIDRQLNRQEEPLFNPFKKPSIILIPRRNTSQKTKPKQKNKKQNYRARVPFSKILANQIQQSKF